MGGVGEWGSVVRLKFPCLNPALERFSATSRLKCEFGGTTLRAQNSYLPANIQGNLKKSIWRIKNLRVEQGVRNPCGD